MPLIFITGLKHSGKSSLGRLSAQALAPSVAVDFYDTDQLIEAHLTEGMSIREFYRLHGADQFRALETQSLRDFLRSLPKPITQVILLATGGGICDNEQAVRLMKEWGQILYLEVGETTLFERIKAHGLPPFLESEDPRASFAQLYDQRHQRYLLLADQVIRLDDQGSLAENAQLVSAAVQQMIGTAV